MTITLTPQWRAILPLLTVATATVVTLATLALFAAHDAWLSRQMAQFAEVIRQSEHVRVEAPEKDTVTAESEAN